MLARVAVVSCCASIGFAQVCPQGFQRDTGFVGLGADIPFPSNNVGTTRAGVDWDPDGPGPLPSWFVVGGQFSAMDGVAAINVVAWDGRQWHPIGAGLPTDPGDTLGVYALRVHNGELFAAGAFRRLVNGAPDDSYLYRWTGQEWIEVPGVAEGSIGVRHLESANQALYVGGQFQLSGSTLAHLARYDASAGEVVPLPAEQYPSGLQAVAAMAALADDLVFSTTTSGTLVWRIGEAGLAALPGDACNLGVINALLVVDNSLYVAGDFFCAASGRSRVARFDEATQAWTQVGSPGVFTSIAKFGDTLLALRSGDTRFFRLSGAATWSFFGPAFSGLNVKFLRQRGEPLFVGGGLNGVPATPLTVETGNFALSNGIAHVDAQGVARPVSRGVDRRVTGFASWSGGTVVVGRFEHAGGQRASRVAWRDADGFLSPMGEGVNADVFAVTVFDGNPVIGGAFTASAATPLSYVAAWNGTEWQPLGAELPFPVRTLMVHQGELFAVCVSNPSLATINSLEGVYRLDDGLWTRLPDANRPTGPTRAIATPFGDMLVGQRVESGTIVYPVRWTGLAWERMGSNTSLDVRAPAMFRGNLVAWSNEGMRRWNGQEWEYFGQYLPPLSHNWWEAVEYAGQLFTTHTGVANAEAIYAWDGSTVTEYRVARSTGGTAAFSVLPPTLHVASDGLLVGGSFLYSAPAGNSQPNFAGPLASYLARFVGPARPLETLAPQGGVFEVGDTVVLSAAHDAPGDYSWSRNGTGTIVDGPVPSGAVMSGATTATLTITNIQPADAAQYRYTLASDCYPTRGNFVPVVVRACDSIDFNNDGSSFDPLDIAAFFSVFSEGPCVPENATCNDVDFNNDGSLFDPQDVDAFLSVFSEGPCF